MLNKNKNSNRPSIKLGARKSTRLKDFDYSSPNDYFITICTHNRECIFGEVLDGDMVLNELGKIVEKEILKTQEIRKNIGIDIFCIMPNHVHIIIMVLCDENNGIDCRGDPLDRPCQADHYDPVVCPNNRATQRVAPTTMTTLSRTNNLTMKYTPT